MAKDFSDTTVDPTLLAVRAADFASPIRFSFYASVGKRIFDIAFVVASSVVVVPLVLILALLVATDGANPFYKQARIGRRGKRFTMWKLRSMVVDADRRLDTYLAENPEARAEWDKYQKLRKDPRITPVGRLIRKISLDELPQFLNVLLGDMSVVGPRPMMVNQMTLYPGTAYYMLRPGVTGPWQVSDRNEAEFKARARLDTKYVSEMSFLTDVKVILKTLRAVTKATGL